MSHSSSLGPPARANPGLCRRVCRHRAAEAQSSKAASNSSFGPPIPSFSTFFPHFLSREHADDKKTLALESEAYL